MPPKANTPKRGAGAKKPDDTTLTVQRQGVKDATRRKWPVDTDELRSQAGIKERVEADEHHEKTAEPQEEAPLQQKGAHPWNKKTPADNDVVEEAGTPQWARIPNSDQGDNPWTLETMEKCRAELISTLPVSTRYEQRCKHDLVHFPTDFEEMKTRGLTMWCKKGCCLLQHDTGLRRTASHGMCWHHPGRRGEHAVVRCFFLWTKREQVQEVRLTRELKAFKELYPQQCLSDFDNVIIPKLDAEEPVSIVATRCLHGDLGKWLTDFSNERETPEAFPSAQQESLARSIIGEYFRIRGYGSGKEQRLASLTHHGDIKPANIILERGFECEKSLKGDSPSFKVQFIDFDFLRVTNERSFSRTATALFGEKWASPDQLFTLTPSAASDIWSLALVVYEVLMCRKPEPGKEGVPVFYQDHLDGTTWETRVLVRAFGDLLKRSVPLVGEGKCIAPFSEETHEKVVAEVWNTFFAQKKPRNLILADFMAQAFAVALWRSEEPIPSFINWLRSHHPFQVAAFGNQAANDGASVPPGTPKRSG